MIQYKLIVTYAVWKSVVQNHTGWTAYHYDDSGSYDVWAGDRDHIFQSRVDEEDLSDWQANFQGSSVVVTRRDDAIAQIVGLTGLRPRQFMSDGTLKVAQQQLTLGQQEFLRTDDGTAQMNVDGTAAGSPVVLWNGTGTGDLDGDWVVSGTGSETAGSNYTGTNGWDTGVMTQSDVFTFDNGSLLDVNGSYGELQFWVQPKAFPTGSRFRCAFLDASNNQIGRWCRIEQYTTNMDLDMWQQVSIPVADFGLTANVQKLRFQAHVKSGQHYWIDDIELAASSGGGPFCFRAAAPDAKTVYHASMVVLVVSAPSGGWNSTAFANIADGLGKGLLVRQRRLSDGEVLWRLNSKDNVDLFGRFHLQEDITFPNGDLLVGFMIKPGKASVVITDDEVLEFVVRDDLSSLSNARAYVHFGTETIPT